MSDSEFKLQLDKTAGGVEVILPFFEKLQGVFVRNGYFKVIVRNKTTYRNFFVQDEYYDNTSVKKGSKLFETWAGSMYLFRSERIIPVNYFGEEMIHPNDLEGFEELFEVAGHEAIAYSKQ